MGKREKGGKKWGIEKRKVIKNYCTKEVNEGEKGRKGLKTEGKGLGGRKEVEERWKRNKREKKTRETGRRKGRGEGKEERERKGEGKGEKKGRRRTRGEEKD